MRDYLTVNRSNKPNYIAHTSLGITSLSLHTQNFKNLTLRLERNGGIYESNEVWRYIRG